MDLGSGSGSGSGESSGERPVLSNYVKVLEAMKHRKGEEHRNKPKAAHRKSHLKGNELKDSDISKIRPVPLSKLDMDLIDALSTGAPSKNIFHFVYESCI